jgi:aspartyl-tRNA synthetase
VKNISAASLESLHRAHGRCENGDLIFFGADKAKGGQRSAGALRAKIGHERGFAKQRWKPLWVLDFPMFEWDDERKRWKRDASSVHLTRCRTRRSARSKPRRGACHRARHGD